MRIEEVNAVLGIDVGTATGAELTKRAVEFCGEMHDCYELGTLERAAFAALQYAIVMGGILRAN